MRAVNSVLIVVFANFNFIAIKYFFRRLAIQFWGLEPEVNSIKLNKMHKST